MQDRPDLVELLESVKHFLETEVLPALPDARLRFRARVAANVLSVAARERMLEAELLAVERLRLSNLLSNGEATVEELNLELARRIRSAEIEATPGSAVWKHLRETAVDKLRIANPAYLKRIGEHGA